MIKYKSLIAVFFILSVFFKITAQNNFADDSIFRNYLFRDFAKAKSVALIDLSESKNRNNDSLFLKSYSNLSEIFYYQKVNDSSLYYSNIALKYALTLNDFEKQASLYNQIGALERRNGNYTKAIKLYQKALKIAKSNDFNKITSEVLNNISLLYSIRDDRQNAIFEVRTSIQNSLKYNYQIPLANSYNILGILYFNELKDSSVYYYKKAIKLTQQNSNDYLQGIVLSNLGDLYLNTENYDEAIKTLNASESIANKVGDKSSLHYVNLSLGIYYEEVDSFSMAILKYKKAIDYYETYVDGFQKLRAYWLMSGAYFHNNEFENAFEYQEMYIKLNEELLSAKKAREFDEIRTKYEVDKKDSQIVLLEKENELAEARRQRILLIGLFIVTALSLLLLYYRNRIKTQKIIRQKEKERLIKEQEVVQVKALIEGQDKERHRMAKELHDGLGGQLASANLTLSQANSEIQNSEINSVSEKLSDIFSDLRILSHNLSANYFNEKTFDELLLELKQQYKSSNAFNVIVSIFPEKSLDDLNGEIKHNLYRILQELFNNSFKHSNCSNVEISINKHSDVITFIYEDDGIGFNTNKQKEGIGLSNINERVKSMNGNLVIDSKQGKGTQVILNIPI